MKVLFIPLISGGLAHMIPLLALNKMLMNASLIETAFLAPGFMGEHIRRLGVNVLDIDYQGWTHHSFRTEMIAYGKFSPDVVVDDTAITPAFSTELAKVPRITIQRTGSFPGYEPSNESHRHSLTLDMSIFPDVTLLGLRQPSSFADLFKADIKVIPGIRSIEILPDHLHDDPSYIFSGPLLMDDDLIDQVRAVFSNELGEGVAFARFKNLDYLQRFFDANKNRKIVYLTFGTNASPPSPIFDCIRFLLENDIAVVSSVEVGGLTTQQKMIYFYAQYLPMHFVCANVDLMVHQCGSGTYHYPIIHNVPMITIGTQCFDREDVALRLQELGVSVHIPSPNECSEFVEIFKSVVSKYFNGTDESIQRKKKIIMSLNEEVQQTSSAFVFEKVLEKVVSSSKGKV